MANYNVYVQHTGGPKTTPEIEVEYPENTVSGTGHTSGSPLELEIGDTLTFQNADTNVGPGNLVISSFGIFTNNDDITISASDTGTFVKTVASGGTTADTIAFDKTNTDGTATTNYFYVERQAASVTGSFSLSSTTVTEGGSITVSNITTSTSANYSLRLWRDDGDSPDSVTNTQIDFTGTSRSNYTVVFQNQSQSEIGYQGEGFTFQLQQGSIGVSRNVDVLAQQAITLYDDEHGTSISDSTIDIGSSATSFTVGVISNWSGTNTVAARIRNTDTNTVVETFNITTNSGTTDVTVSSGLPSSGSDSYRVEVYNGNEYLNGATFTVTRTAASPTAPTISSVGITGGATTNMTATVNLSDTGTNGTLEYAQTTTNSVPSTGWQTSNQFTHPRPPASGPAPSTRYYWASRNRNTSAYSAGFQRDVGYFTGDPSVDAPTLNPTSPIAASYSGTVAATITGGSTSTRYRIVNTTTGLGTGNTGDGNGTIYIGSVRASDLPDAGETDNYKVQYKVLESKGGNDLWADVNPARTFSIARTSSVCPTTNTTHTITGVTSGSSQTLSQTSKVTSGNSLSISLTTPYNATSSMPTSLSDRKSLVSASITSGGGSKSVSHSGTSATITYTPAYTTTQSTAVLSITHQEYEPFAEDIGDGTIVYTWNLAYTDTITLTVTICPQTQTLVDITSVDSVTPNENTSDQVTATVTTPSGVSVSSYAWSTTGNITLSSSTVQSPILSFGNVTADSSASVTVTVTDSNNNTATDTQNYTIQFVNQAPVAIIQGPSSGDVDSSVTFSGSDSYDPDGGSVQYQWSATNGGETFTQAKSTTSSFSFTPTETGSYTVTLTAHDSANATNVTTKSYLSTTTESENTGSAGGFGFEIYAANGDTILRADELLIRKVAAVDLDSNGAASTTIQNTESQTTVVGFQSTDDSGSLSLSASGTTTKSVSISGGVANTRVSLFLLK